MGIKLKKNDFICILVFKDTVFMTDDFDEDI